ncbi:hypothetical protein [Gimesia algae]|uniref:Phage major tail protein 2 n=1 Tax=Gimesia algae TaxID=2527971 RepID=A0A517VMP5_9PLAN|nr:hypothetical protein [Gimesia algae]QDT94266.1 hypothetical protein Pan161_59610 [Gimesia algae]
MTIGLEAGLYLDPAGMAGEGTWTLYEDVGDVNVAHSWNQSQRKIRKHTHERTTLGQGVLEVTFTVTYRAGDAGFEMLRDAHANKSIIAVAVMSGLIAAAGSEGWQFDAVVSDFPESQALEEDMTFDVTLKPASGSAVDPVRVEISGS